MEVKSDIIRIDSTWNKTNDTFPTSVFYSIGALFVLITLFALMEHILIILAFVLTPKLRTPDNVLFMGLCATDVALTCLSLPLVVISCFAKSWAFGPTWCIIYAYITTALGLTQITLLSAIALERYFVIVRFSRPLSLSQACALIFCCILHGFGWAVGPLLGWSAYKIESIQIACSVDWETVTPVGLSFSISLLTFCWLIPLVIICFRIWIHYTQGAFVISWLPYSMIAFLSITSHTDAIPTWLWVASSAVAKCSIIWNPIIYIARNRPFRNATKNVLTTIWHLRTSRRTSGSGNTLEVLPQVEQDTNMIEMESTDVDASAAVRSLAESPTSTVLLSLNDENYIACRVTYI